jgi:hypothetical protein
MGDIVVTSGLEEPYAIPYTDPDNTQSLRNLLIGKFAFLGSEAGVQLKNQTLEMQKVVDSVNYVSDILDQIKTPLVWTPNDLDLDISDQVGLTPSSPNFNFSKLFSATNKMTEAGFDFGGITNFKVTVTDGNGNGLVKYIDRSNYQVFKENYFINNLQNIVTDPSGSVIKVDRNDGSSIYFFSVGFSSPGFNLFEIDKPQGFAIPATNEQLSNWNTFFNLQINADILIKKTNDLLLNKTVLYGIPIEAGDLGKFDDPKIAEKYKNNIYADIKVNFDTIKVNISNVTKGDFFFNYPIKSISVDVSATLETGNLYTLDIDKADPKKIFYTTGLGSSVEVKTSEMKLFIKNPSDSEVQSWRSQFAEKQVQLTQKSATLQNFLNELIQIYNYTFEAATNLLRAFSSLLSDISRNL